jgi:hypothetical protein
LGLLLNADESSINNIALLKSSVDHNQHLPESTGLLIDRPQGRSRDQSISGHHDTTFLLDIGI